MVEIIDNFNRPDRPDLSLSPEIRGTGHMFDIADQRPNSHGVVPLKYEYINNAKTGWRQFRCRCGQEMYRNKSHSQVTGCGKCGGSGGLTQTKLQLLGKKFGKLTVTGHERGLGWKVKCECGNERTILNGSQIAAGGYTSCGRCEKFQTRRKPPIAPSSDLRSSDSADQVYEQYGIATAFNGPASSCADGHTKIVYRPSDSDDGYCPLCMSLAQIEVLQS